MTSKRNWFVDTSSKYFTGEHPRWDVVSRCLHWLFAGLEHDIMRQRLVSGDYQVVFGIIHKDDVSEIKEKFEAFKKWSLSQVDSL